MSNKNQRRALQVKGGIRTSGEPTAAEVSRLVSLFNQQQLHEAEAAARMMTECFPRFGFGWKVLGAVLKSEGRREEALPAMRKATELLPGDPQAETNLGVTLKELGRLDEAEACYLRAIERKPDYAEAHYMLGNIHKQQGRLEHARDRYRLAVSLSPTYPGAMFSLGNVLMEMGVFHEAAACLEAAAGLEPGSATVHYNLGNVLSDLGRTDEAMKQYQTALAITPDFAEAHYNLGITFRNTGSLHKAIDHFRNALDCKPDYPDAFSNLLSCMNSVYSRLPDDYLELAHRFGRLLSMKTTHQFTSWNCSNNPERLKVGIVSGDLRNHPVGFFLESILPEIDRNMIELTAYVTDNRVDELTERIRPYFSAWHSLGNLHDDAAARLIHDDGIHLLLDLSGHTERNRLPLFVRKPAPVQASWLGYFATTGVKEMDFLVADRIGVPPEQQSYFTETLWYLSDTRLCFTPPAADIAATLSVTELPALLSGRVTFGCFQNLTKVGDPLLALWNRILGEVPGSRLRFQCKQLGDPNMRDRFYERLQDQGIERSRVELCGAVSRFDYLAAHTDIDLILDTFPYTGGTTTCEALWMGVPTLTMTGDTLISRQGASLLAAAGLPDWIAENESQYREKAVECAANLPKLSSLRKGLRQQLLASPLADAPLFAARLTAAFQGMWEQRQGTNR